MDQFLTIRGVSKRLEARGGRSFQLRCDALSLHEGERAAVLGRSGAGKTTLLFLMAGFIRPDTGLVSFSGSPLLGPAISRQIVFQGDSSLFFWMTVRENVLFAMEAAGRSDPAECDALLEEVGLHEVRGAWPKELSGGMRKRLELARALAPGPKLLLLDEAFGSLDFMTKASVMDLLLRLQSERRFSLVIVTHDLDEVAKSADTLFLIENGEVRPGSANQMNAIKSSTPLYEKRRALFETVNASL